MTWQITGDAREEITWTVEERGDYKDAVALYLIAHPEQKISGRDLARKFIEDRFESAHHPCLSRDERGWKLHLAELAKFIADEDGGPKWLVGTLRVKPVLRPHWDETDDSTGIVLSCLVSESIIESDRLARESDQMVAELRRGNDATKARLPWWLLRNDPDQHRPALSSPRKFKEDIATSVEEATTEAPCCLLFVDFDNLKELNSRVTDPVADIALIAVTEIVAKVSQGRGGAYMRARGDEFMMLFPNTTVAEGLSIAERVRASCAALVLSRGLSAPTVSIGVASFPESATERDTLEEYSALAVKVAKIKGRNQVKAWEQKDAETIRAHEEAERERNLSERGSS